MKPVWSHSIIYVDVTVGVCNHSIQTCSLFISLAAFFLFCFFLHLNPQFFFMA